MTTEPAQTTGEISVAQGEMQAEMELDMNDPDAQVRMSGDSAQSASTMDIEDGSAGKLLSSKYCGCICI